MKYLQNKPNNSLQCKYSTLFLNDIRYPDQLAQSNITVGQKSFPAIFFPLLLSTEFVSIIWLTKMQVRFKKKETI